MRRAVVVPSAPLLVAALAPGTGDHVRAVVLDVLRTVVAPVVLVGPGTATRRHGPSAWGTLAGLGVAVEAPVRHPTAGPTLPTSLTVGRHLLEVAGVRAQDVVEAAEVDVDATGRDCAGVAAGLVADHPAATWVVLGDGSARRTARAPGAFDARAQGFDAEVGRALAQGDAPALAALDQHLAADLLAAGRTPWQVLAAAATTKGAPVEAVLHLDDAPYGVGYFVATWGW